MENRSVNARKLQENCNKKLKSHQTAKEIIKDEKNNLFQRTISYNG